jgi:hypothetical protein
MAIIYPNNTITEVGTGQISYPGNLVQTVEQKITATLSFYNWSTQNQLGTASITPSSSSSKILVYIHTNFRFDGNGQGTWALGMIWLHNTTRNVNLIQSGWDGTWRHVISSYQKSYLDSPNSTATQTYSLRFGNYPAGGGTFFANAGTASDGICIIRLQEFA